MVNRSPGEIMEIRYKKGIFFTILVILIFSLFLASFTFYSGIKERKAAQKRIESMNGFLNSVEEDLPRKLFVSGFRSIFLIETKITETGQYSSNLDGNLQEIFFNGTLNQQPQDLMIGATFPELEQDIMDSARKINVNISLNNPSLSISQQDPWNVAFALTVNIVMEDRGGLASWNKTKTLVGLIPVENFEDPVYIVNTNGLVVNKIIKEPFPYFVNGSDISNLLNHSENSYYAESPDAPSFLDRLQGVITESPNGIESLVNLQELSQRGINVQDKSVVDHIYFSAGNPGACHVPGMPSWFKLDDEHLSLYQAGC